MSTDQTIGQVPPGSLDQLRTLDACTVSNAIERLDVRLRNEEFTDISVRCLSPNLLPMVGYAATGRIRPAAAPIARYCYYDHIDFWESLAAIPAPCALGCIGYVINGAVRDLPGIGRTEFHLFASGVSVSLAYAHVVDFGGPVQVGGLRANPGDLLHGDLHGVVSVPAAIAGEIPKCPSKSATAKTRRRGRHPSVVPPCRRQSTSREGRC